MRISKIIKRTANKEHFCTFCSRRILPGEGYYNYTRWLDGSVGKVKAHSWCFWAWYDKQTYEMTRSFRWG